VPIRIVSSAPPNKATADAKAFEERLVDDPVYLAKLTKDLRARKVAAAIEQMIWYYAKGKPKDVIDLEGRLNADALYRAPDAELIARMEVLLAKAKQHEARMTKPDS
jgi:hypothetical protein